LSTGNRLSIYTPQYVALFGVGGASTVVFVATLSASLKFRAKKNKKVSEIDAARAAMTTAVVQQTLRRINKAGNYAMLAFFRLSLRASYL